jgi:hypothetical protein
LASPLLSVQARCAERRRDFSFGPALLPLLFSRPKISWCGRSALGERHHWERMPSCSDCKVTRMTSRPAPCIDRAGLWVCRPSPSGERRRRCSPTRRRSFASFPRRWCAAHCREPRKVLTVEVLRVHRDERGSHPGSPFPAPHLTETTAWPFAPHPRHRTRVSDRAPSERAGWQPLSKPHCSKLGSQICQVRK